MKRTMWHWIVLVALVALSAGCAKKTAAPPEPPPAPPQEQTQTPTPPPTPTPAEQPPAPTGVRSEDLQPAFFDLDSYTLRDDARSALDGNARLLRDNSSVRVTIEGHCDERGTVEYNQSLGERRAQAARDYLIAAGIDAGRIDMISYGKERPFDPGHDEAAWAKNRRAHFVVR
jgi:peptidoglycan-associated lipoprotein